MPRGRLHPITQTLRDMLAAFGSMGFQMVEGPEVEWDYYNFEALRIPQDHPARDMWDTLWIDYEKDGRRPMLLRTHTSPNQVQGDGEARAADPHRRARQVLSLRGDGRDARVELTQIEGLAVDEGISLTDLKGTLAEFARRIFGQDRKVRFLCVVLPLRRAGHGDEHRLFPSATAPAAALATTAAGSRSWARAWCTRRSSTGMGYDPERYTGFAFGVGVERIALLRYGVDDIRHFYANDLRFLRQF